MDKRILMVVLLGLFGLVQASEESLVSKPQSLSDHDWDLVEQRMALLNNISYLPSLLPMIMKNRDSLELTPQQVEDLRTWRRDNYQHMVDLMNIIIQRRIQLAQAAVQPAVDRGALLQLQDEIFSLQREVFVIRLSCRELVTGSFTEEQWSNFAFVAAEDPKIAGLLQH